jgi:hypothetical protein
MQGFIYEEGSFGVFILVTVILGGGAAALAGRAIAVTWRPWWQVVAYGLILGKWSAIITGSTSRTVLYAGAESRPDVVFAG